VGPRAGLDRCGKSRPHWDFLYISSLKSVMGTQWVTEFVTRMAVVRQPYFKIVEENNYMFRPFSGWDIVRLRLEYRRKLIYYNVDIKNGGRRSRFTMFGEVCSYIYAMWNLR
jgi:hypothetical protein